MLEHATAPEPILCARAPCPEARRREAACPDAYTKIHWHTRTYRQTQTHACGCSAWIRTVLELPDLRGLASVRGLLVVVVLELRLVELAPLRHPSRQRSAVKVHLELALDARLEGLIPNVHRVLIRRADDVPNVRTYARTPGSHRRW